MSAYPIGCDDGMGEREEEVVCPVRVKRAGAETETVRVKTARAETDKVEA
jgi:hypothetical protein